MHRLLIHRFSYRPGYRLLLLLCVGVSMVMLAPQRTLAAGFTVNHTGDTVDATLGNGICADAANVCTLRAAIMEANALAGADTISLPAGTFTLNRSGSDDNATNGDLDVTGPLTINGNSQAGTIIQAGTTNTNGIDKIFSFNPVGAGAGFAVTLTNLTLRFGRNPETYANFNGFGGCLDFDTGTNAAAPGSLTLSNVTITDCSTTDADGGGMALFLNKGGTINISNSTLQNNKAGTNLTATSGLGGGIFFGTTDAGNTVNVTLNNATIANNQALGGAKQGGGLFIFGGAGNYSYQLHAVTISGNSAASDGGGIWSTAPLVIDQSSLISNNSSGRSGGGIWLNHANRTSTISQVTISGNQATDGGGGIRLDSGSPGNNLTLSFSRLVNNTAGSGKGSGLSVNNGAATAVNNWWGCSTGPSATPCDAAKVDPGSGGGPAGTGIVNVTPWLRLNLTAATNPLVTGQSTGLTASFLTDSNGGAVTLGNLSVLLGLPVTWSGVGGTIAGQQATMQAAGTATANYQATLAAASNRAVAKVDNDSTTTGSNGLNLTVNQANTTATITADTPDPSTAGQAVTVNYNVTVNSPGAGTPTGNVTVSDGVDSCTATVAAGSCNVTLTTVGARTLTATYAGDGNFNGSTSAGAAHTVNPTTQAPQITTQPTNQTVCAGSNASFTAAASGNPTPTVQWQVSSDNGATWNDLSGETSPTLNVVTSAADNGKQYRAVFTNSAGSAASSAVTLTVNTTPTISTQPSNQPVNAGQAVSFSAAASGSPAPTVQWQVSSDNGATWNDLGGETATTLSFTAQSSDNGKQYRAVFTNSCGTATSAAATLTVTTQQSDLTISKANNVGGNAVTGQIWNWTLTVNNTGGAGAVFPGTFIILSDNLPDGDIVYGTPIVVNVTNVTGDEGISCTIDSNKNLVCLVIGAPVVLGAFNGSFGVQIPATASTVGAYANPRSGGSCSVDPDAKVAESNEANNACNPDTVTVTAAPTPDLTISKSHTGNFTQGQTAAQYTIQVTNNGNGPASGTVTLVDTLPAGLTATALSGSGWNCTLGTLTCTRSDGLAAGSSYPDLILTVNVASNAPSSVTNSVTVAGGGEQNTSNNTANDPTTINTVPPADTTAPDTTINSQPANPSNSSSASFTFSGTDNVTPAASLTFECRLDGAAFAACTSPQNYSNLADGAHTFQVRTKDAAGNVDPSPAEYTWQVQAAYQPLIMISSNKNGAVPGLSFRDEDIMAYDPNRAAWQMIFDGSDVGLGNNDLDAFAFLPNGHLLLSVEKDFTLNGFGPVDDADILEFLPTRLGSDTQGSYAPALYLDGSTVGLGSSDEDIDAIDFTAQGQLLVSVRGSFASPDTRGADEDLLALDAASRTWSLYFDGSQVGLTRGGEDVQALWADHARQQLYLATLDNYAVPDLSGNEDDIFVCTYSALGANTACTFSLYWDGKAHGFTQDAIDGLALGSAPVVNSQAQSVAGLIAVDDTVEFDGDDADEPNPLDGEEEALHLFLPLLLR